MMGTALDVHPPSGAPLHGDPVGVLGGSFDPVHVGHLALARAALDGLPLAQVRLLPAGQPWQKGALAAAAADRQRMIELAIAGDARLVADARELRRPGPTYTINTLRELRAELGARTPLMLILGADQLQRLNTWRHWQALTDFAHLAVAGRPRADTELPEEVRAFIAARRAEPAAIAARPAGGVLPIAMAPVEASATEVRALLAQPPSPARDARLARLLPPAVLDYIRRHSLYG